MTEMKLLFKEYLSDNDNRFDYNAFLRDKDEILFKRVVVAWCEANNYREESDLLASYIVNQS